MVIVAVMTVALPAHAVYIAGSGASDRPEVGPDADTLVRVETDGLAPDVAERLLAATAAWSSVFAGSADCLGTTTVRFEDLPGLKGGYVVQDREVVLNPNRPTSTLSLVAVHELSHHVMMACDLNHDEGFRLAFYEAQGLPLERGWFEYGAGWESAPAEHLAEAATLLVLGTSSGRIAVSDETVQLLAEWTTRS